MYEYARTMGNMLALAILKKLKNINVLINYIILKCDLILSWVEMLGKMFKVYKRTTTDFELKNKETKNLKKNGKMKAKKNCLKKMVCF